MSIFQKIRATVETILQIGLGGPNVKANAGAIEMRNAADAAFAITRGAPPVGADDYVTKGSLAAIAFPVYPLAGVTSKTSGASSITQEETTTNKVNDVSVQFAQGVQSFWEIGVFLPNWDGGTITATYYWFAATASAGAVVFGAQGQAYSDAAPVDGAFGADVEVTDANNGNTDVNISATSGAITIAGAVGDPQWVQMRFYRLGSGADVLAATAKLLCVVLRYNRS